jgi:hypothetical protein
VCQRVMPDRGTRHGRERVQLARPTSRSLPGSDAPACGPTPPAPIGHHPSVLTKRVDNTAAASQRPGAQPPSQVESAATGGPVDNRATVALTHSRLTAGYASVSQPTYASTRLDGSGTLVPNGPVIDALIDAHADDLVAVLDRIGAGTATIVGHSMGGFGAVSRAPSSSASRPRRNPRSMTCSKRSATNQDPWYKQRNTRRFSRSAVGLSADYQALADEILGRFVARSQQAAPA